VRARRGLHGTVVDELGSQIVSGAIPEGTVLVPDELCERYGVSRTVVRETLRVLEAKGLLSARQNVGTRVHGSSDWDVLDHDVILWRIRSSDYAAVTRELLEMRSAVEPHAAGLAARRADETGVRELREAYVAMVEAAGRGDVGAWTSADIVFHSALLRASGNPMIAQLSKTVAAALEARSGEVAVEGISPHAVDMHGALVDAVSSGDAVAAQMRMEELLGEAGDQMATLMDRLDRAQTG